MTVPRSFGWSYPLFGLPYNGLATNEVLTLPGGRKMDYPFSGHQAVLVEGRNKGRQPPRTAPQKEFCRQQGYTFRPYALLSGYYREIGGVQLGPQSWLYCDDDHAWRIRLDLARISGTNRFHLKLVLVNVFGLLEWDGTPPTMDEERVLAEIVFPLRYRYIEARETSCDCAQYLFLTHSRHGDVSVINMCVSRDEVGDCDFQGPGFGYQFASTNGFELHAVIQATVSGTGSIAAGSVGRGIAGGLVLLAQTPDLIVQSEQLSNTGDAGRCSGSGEEGRSGGTVSTWTYSETFRHYAAITPDGAIMWAESKLEGTSVLESTETLSAGGVSGEILTTVANSTTSLTATALFGSVSLTQTSETRTHSETVYDCYGIWISRSFSGSSSTFGDAGSADKELVSQYDLGFAATASISTMFAPDVFSMACGGPPNGVGIVVASSRGHVLIDYSDPPGGASRLVAYNPGTGEFAVAPTPSDLVQWV